RSRPSSSEIDAVSCRARRAAQDHAGDPRTQALVTTLRFGLEPGDAADPAFPVGGQTKGSQVTSAVYRSTPQTRPPARAVSRTDQCRRAIGRPPNPLAETRRGPSPACRTADG